MSCKFNLSGTIKDFIFNKNVNDFVWVLWEVRPWFLGMTEDAGARRWSSDVTVKIPQ